MNWTWRDFSQNNQKWLKTAWLIAAALTAIYVGAIAPLQEARGLNASRQTGLGAVAFDPVSAWRTRSVMPKLARSKGYVGGGGSGESVRDLTDKVQDADQQILQVFIGVHRESISNSKGSHILHEWQTGYSQSCVCKR